MRIIYLDSNGKMITIPNVQWFSFASLTTDFQIIYYLGGDDKQYELLLPFGTPVLVDNCYDKESY